jgi:UTP--glucose-1-phosphate uridylyltransferase
MIKWHEEYQATILALQRVPRAEIHRYGIIAGKEIRSNLYEISDLVEKPKPFSAPSDIAIIGRYILTPEIFPCIESTPLGKGGEMQLTDSLKTLLKKGPIYGYLFEGKRYDGGDKVGYLKATVEFALKHPAVKSEFRKYLLSMTKRIKN